MQYNQGGQQGYGSYNPYSQQNPGSYQDSGNPYAQQGGNPYAQQDNYGGRPQYQQHSSSNYNDPEQGNAGYGKRN